MVRTWRGKQRRTIYFIFFKWLLIKEGVVQFSLTPFGFKIAIHLKYIIVFSKYCWQARWAPHWSPGCYSLPVSHGRTSEVVNFHTILANLFSLNNSAKTKQNLHLSSQSILAVVLKKANITAPLINEPTGNVQVRSHHPSLLVPEECTTHIKDKSDNTDFCITAIQESSSWLGFFLAFKARYSFLHSSEQLR